MSSPPTRNSVRPLPAQGGNSSRVSINECDREPIHVPGAIQPHGALVAFDPASGAVLHTSANLESLLPLGLLPAVGRSLSDLVGETGYAAIQSALKSPLSGVVRHHVVELDPVTGDTGTAPLLAVVHLHRGVGIAEFERAPGGSAQQDWVQVLGDTIDALRAATDLDELVERTARRIKLVTGMDRVMVYRFDEQWNGQVLADAHEPDMESYLDLHYPASDIPAQARELYRSNLVRYIANVDYIPQPVNPRTGDDATQPLDMSHSVLRAVSPMHIQYLRNMGVRSTLTISLLVDGKLWGLIACHHRTPTAMHVRLRRACSALAVSIGYMVGWNEQRARAEATASFMEMHGRILEAFNQVQAPLSDIVDQCGHALVRIADATGGALWCNNAVYPFGKWPDGPRGESVIRFARDAFERQPDSVLCAEKATLWPGLKAEEMRTVCGLMAARLDELGTSGIVWIRPEFRREVIWGGDPDKPVHVERDASGQPRLSPRSSFARWETVVAEQCRPWSALDQDAARALTALRQVLVVRASIDQVSLSERRFRGLVALQGDVYWRSDSQDRLVTLSKALPFMQTPVEGRTLFELLAPCLDPAGLAALGAALDDTKPVRNLRIRGTHPQAGYAFELLLNGERLQDPNGKAAGWHGTLTDVTHETTLQEANRRKETAELANQAKSRFMTHISRELRTPLDAVVGFSDLLLMEPGITEKHRAWIFNILESGKALNALLGELLQVSDIDNGELKISLAAVDASQVVREAADALRPLVAASRMRLTLEGTETGHWVASDAQRLKQALVQLASHAIASNQTHGQVHIAIHPDEMHGHTRIEVHDTGRGINLEQQSKLFQIFNRLGRDSLESTSTGAGLVTTRYLIEAMGGRVAVDSDPRVGTCYSVILVNASVH